MGKEEEEKSHRKYTRWYEALRASIPPDRRFGHYLLDLLVEQHMSIKRLCRETSSAHFRFNEYGLRRLIQGKDRTMTDLDLIRIAKVLHTDPVRMIEVYMADKARYEDLSAEEKHRVALYTTFMNMITRLPEPEVRELISLAQTKNERYHDEIDQERARLHKSRAGGFATSGKGKK